MLNVSCLLVQFPQIGKIFVLLQSELNGPAVQTCETVWHKHFIFESALYASFVVTIIEGILPIYCTLLNRGIATFQVLRVMMV